MHILAPNGTAEIYPYSIGQLRKDNPQVSFPKNPTDALLASYGVFPVTRPDRPEHDGLTSKVVDSNCEQDAVGNWVLNYVVEQLPVDQAERNIRSHRDGLLKDTDWIVIKSYERGENIPAVWELYRQALRDISTQTGFPYSVEWPTKPE